jgi:signal transduction histidine kinase/ActR/RegA family two-component response regulator/HPt (histidine-containing phosphotransfer) domain-containing protein
MSPWKTRDTASGKRVDQRSRALLLWMTGIIMLAVVGAQTFVLIDSGRSDREGAKDNLFWILSQVIVEVQFAESQVLAAFAEGQPTLPQRIEKIRTSTEIALSRMQVAISAYRSFYESDKQLSELVSVRHALNEIADIVEGNPTLETWVLEKIHQKYQFVVSRSYDVVTARLYGLLAFEQQQREERARLIRYAMIGVWLSAGLLLVAVFQGLRANRLFTVEAEKTELAAIRLQRTFDASPYSVCLLDYRLNVISHNNKCEMFARLSNEADGGVQNLADYLYPNDRTMIENAVEIELERCAANGQTESAPALSFQIDMVGVSGAPIPVEFILARLAGQGINAEFVVYIRDRSADVAAERDLRTARDRAIADASIKERFLTLIGHELRTPLQGVLAAVELIDAEDSAVRSEFLRSSAKQCAQSALAQIDNVLLHARSGRLNEAEEPFSPKDIVESIVQEFAALAAENQNDLVLHVEAEQPDILVLGPATSFNLAVRNLLSNAIKYTEHGKVTARLSMNVVKLEVDVVFSVADTGLGISEDHLPELFDEYMRIGQKDEVAPTGFGLGLPIAKASVERLGGQILVKSAVGQGSLFEFSFRAPARERPSAGLPDPETYPSDMPPNASKRVLLVEDDLVNQTLLLAMLHRLGHSGVAASDGEQALTLSHEQTFDHILMDLGLPGMDGIATAKALLQTDLNRFCPITILTARDPGEVQFQARQAGIIQVIRKPVDMERLRLVLTEQPDATAIKHGGPLLAPDFEKTIDLVGRTAMQALVAATLAENSDAITALREWDSSGTQADGIIRIVHKAVGSSGVIGLSRLSSAWQDVETHLRNRGTIPKGAVEGVDKIFCATQREIETIAM